MRDPRLFLRLLALSLLSMLVSGPVIAGNYDASIEIGMITADAHIEIGMISNQNSGSTNPHTDTDGADRTTSHRSAELQSAPGHMVYLGA